MTYAVLVIDIQTGLVTPSPTPFEIDLVIERINKVTELARENKAPVIMVQHECPNSILEHGSDNWQLPPELTTERSDHIVRKTTPDSFLKTNLDELLKSREVKNLIICGYASEFCVDTTVRRAAALGYNVQLVSDAHTTHDKAHTTANNIRAHENATLPNITSFGSKISAIPTEDIRFKV
ncbi:cysteine hydrolase family protein [Kiloniella sp.]|uniref:cysteine hydrolase family protein n=1 Tax=Kiloniella sp. TaxID=1938587 RepID=UPI003B015AE6